MTSIVRTMLMNYERMVQLSGGKSLEIRVQPGRLERLLGTRHGPGGAAAPEA